MGEFYTFNFNNYLICFFSSIKQILVGYYNGNFLYYISINFK